LQDTSRERLMRIGILTISDRASAGLYEDKSGLLLEELILGRTAWQVSCRETVPDEREAISSILVAWADDGLNLVLTTGGTGFGPRDVTPEATLEVVERLAPGIAEALRAESLKVTRHAMLSRGVAGIRDRTLIINMPGSPKAVRENLEMLLPVLPHALDLLAGKERAEGDHRSI
jgi:molybdopterin adenylyltransferase